MGIYWVDTSWVLAVYSVVVQKKYPTNLRDLLVISPFLMLFYAYSCPLCNLNFPLEYNHDTSQLNRTGHDDVSCTRMTTLAFILSELFPLDGFICNFVSARYLENR